MLTVEPSFISWTTWSLLSHIWGLQVLLGISATSGSEQSWPPGVLHQITGPVDSMSGAMGFLKCCLQGIPHQNKIIWVKNTFINFIPNALIIHTLPYFPLLPFYAMVASIAYSMLVLFRVSFLTICSSPISILIFSLVKLQ